MRGQEALQGGAVSRTQAFAPRDEVPVTKTKNFNKTLA